MKILFFFIIFISITIIGLYFINPDLFQTLRNTITNSLSTITPIESVQTKTTIYKWVNDKGEPQFTNNPPPDGIKYKTELVPNGTNIMPSKVFTSK